MPLEPLEGIAEQFTKHRLTPQRRLVLEILSENKDLHLSAKEVYQALRKKGYEVGVATVYRTLDLLDEMGLIHRLNFGDGCNRFELSSLGLGHNHHHLLCLECRSITEVEEDFLQKLEETVEIKHGFRVTDHRVQLYGYCQKCREKHRSP